ncbi:hypothetical protein F5X99DRAFT_431191 [Biscogniauxia marginata]|nr:hypothetical protein F5X99DRAFT_431191 [Biscogniauxia marginata]
MASSWEEIICSPPLKFVVGPELKQFTLHSGAVKYLSTKLDTYIFLQEMAYEEGEDSRPIDWLDVNVETFLRFAHFVYTGEYNVPVPSSPSQDNDDDYDNNAAVATTTSSEGDHNHNGTVQARTTFNRRIGPYHSLDSWHEVLRHNPHKRPAPEQGGQQAQQYDLLREFCALPYAAATVAATTAAPPDDHDPYPDFDSTTLLAHARLFALAARNRVPSLRRAALDGIYRLLRYGDFLYDRVEDVVALVDFAFAPLRSGDYGDHDGDVGGGEAGLVYQFEEEEPDGDDALRDMVTLYGACVYGVFLLHPSFVAVCREHGEFSAGMLDWLRGEDGASLGVGNGDAEAEGPGESLEDIIDDLAEEQHGDWGTYEDWWDVCG